MRNTRSARFVLSAAAMSLTLAACSGSGSSGSWQAPPPTLAAPAAGGTQPFVPPNGEPYDAVFYDNPGVNPFIDAEDDAFSTFALDVDTGSYTIHRRYLTDGNLPDKDSVRVEEFVNFFDQDYAAPDVEDGLSLSIDGGETPFLQNPRNRVVRVGVQAGDVDPETRGDANLVFVIDTSGSMDREDRLETVKKSLEMLVASLRPSDSIGIVEYGSQARTILEPTPVANEGTIISAINSLRPNGSTNAAAGLTLAYEMANNAYQPNGINRVILCSDGVANVGAATDADGILEMIKDDAEVGIELVTVGFGMGNYNDVMMEQLANSGDGFYAYVDTLDEARRLFVDDLQGTLQTVAKEAKIQVEFDRRVVQSWRLIGFENRALEDEDFRDDSVDAGEIGSGHTVTALYEIKPVPDATGVAGVARLRWEDPTSGAIREIEEPIALGLLDVEFERTAPHFQLDVTVAQYAEVLRESIWAEQAGTDMAGVLTWSERVASLFPEDPDVVEFAGLVRQAAALSR